MEITSYADRERVATLDARFFEVAASGRKYEMLHIVAEQEGIPFKTLEKQWAKWRKGGAVACADRRRLPRGGGAESIFYPDYKTYVERDANTDAGAYRAMLDDIRRGKVFSFGTWRDIFRRDFPFEEMPPMCPANWTPRGFTYANMNRLLLRDPSRAMATAWSRQGMFAALKATLPVLRSRIGLKPGQVYQADDVWHNIDTYTPGQKGVFNPLEFAIYDVASAYKAVSAMKPRILRIDPKSGKEVRDNLKEMQFRFAMAHLVCEVGFHRDGVLFILERGTTALRDNVIARVKTIPEYGSLFHFQTSGVKNSPVVKGMFMGNAGGNPRMKSLCECAHNIMHNATASLLGSHGRDAAHLKEDNAAVVKYSARMIEEAQKLDATLVQQLMLPILDYRHYQQYFYAIQDSVMDRRDHKLEGWTENERTYYRLGREMAWRPCAELADLAPEKAGAITAWLAAHPDDMCMMRMSRREVWAAGQKDLVRLPLIELPAFLDPRDVREGVVREDGTIVFEDALYFPGERKIYLAEYADRNGLRHRLAPGAKVAFYWCPVGNLANQIWIAADDEERSVLGMAPALKTARWCDPESIKVAMGQQAHQIAELMADARARQAEDVARQLAAKEYNAALLEAAKEQRSKDEGPMSNVDAVDFETLAGEGVVKGKREEVRGDGSDVDESMKFLEQVANI